MTGWGRTSGGGPIPSTLQYAVTYLISETECRATWGSQVTSRMQCANDNTNSACNVSYSCSSGNKLFDQLMILEKRPLVCWDTYRGHCVVFYTFSVCKAIFAM